MSKGLHVIIDCCSVPEGICEDDKRILEAVLSSVKWFGATVINTSRYRFGANSPPGCTVFVMLDESHISIHTYSYEGKMALDVFMCGEGAKHAKAVANRLLADLGVEDHSEQVIERF